MRERLRLVSRALTLAVKLGSAFLLLASLASSSQAAAEGNDLPRDAEVALEQASSVTLYSLEDRSREAKAPSERFHGYQVLGKLDLTANGARAAAEEFEKAVAEFDGSVAACFDPHHALRVVAGTRAFNFLLCYSCGQMVVFERGKERPIGGVGVTGSAAVLNGILTSAGIPLAYIYGPEFLAEEAKRAREREDAKARWRNAMSPSIRAFWTDELARSAVPMLPAAANPQERVRHETLLAPFRTALARDYADERARILALLRWFGSGTGPWSGFPAYEEWPEALLFDYSTAEIVSAIERTRPSPTELEGAARFFGGWAVHTRRADSEELPEALKAELLEHVQRTSASDKDKLSRATAAFR